MCQSAKTSLVAWVIAAVIALIIISSGKSTSKWNGYFILTFILVQLLEFFIWNERERKGLTSSASEAVKEGPNSVRNAPSGEAYTRLILIALWLQPLIQTFMAYKYGKQAYKPQLMVLTICYLVLFLWSITQALNEEEQFSSHPSVGCEGACDPNSACPGGHLEWKRSKSTGFLGPAPAGHVYLLGLFLGLLFMQPGIFGVMLTALGGVMVTYTAKQLHSGETSSMWCLYAVFYVFLALIISFSRRNSK